MCVLERVLEREKERESVCVCVCVCVCKRETETENVRVYICKREREWERGGEWEGESVYVCMQERERERERERETGKECVCVCFCVRVCVCVCAQGSFNKHCEFFLQKRKARYFHEYFLMNIVWLFSFKCPWILSLHGLEFGAKKKKKINVTDIFALNLLEMPSNQTEGSKI